MKKEKQKKLDELEERRQRYEKMKKLEDDGLVQIKKAFIGRKTRTTYSCTGKGKKAIQIYLSAVETVLKSSL